MSQETRNGEIASADEAPVEAVYITGRLVLTAMVSGLVGMVLMVPLLVGVPVLFGVFRTEPIAQFANFGGAFFGPELSLMLGIVLFVIGGMTVLPLMFLVVGAFLPPEKPRFARGITFATIIWTGFLLGFWPGEGAFAIAIFLIVSLLSHWIYGATLGYLLDRFAQIPQHDV